MMQSRKIWNWNTSVRLSLNFNIKYNVFLMNCYREIIALADYPAAYFEVDDWFILKSKAEEISNF